MNKLFKILGAAIISLTLIACGSPEQDTGSAAALNLTVPSLITEVTTPEIVSPDTLAPAEVNSSVTTRVSAPEDAPADVTCNIETFIPCAAPVPVCKAGDVLVQGVCTLSVCNTETYNPCAIAPPICREAEVRVNGVCTTLARPLAETAQNTSTCARDAAPLVYTEPSWFDNCGTRYSSPR